MASGVPRAMKICGYVFWWLLARSKNLGKYLARSEISSIFLARSAKFWRGPRSINPPFRGPYHVSPGCPISPYHLNFSVNITISPWKTFNITVSPSPVKGGGGLMKICSFSREPITSINILLITLYALRNIKHALVMLNESLRRKFVWFPIVYTLYA